MKGLSWEKHEGLLSEFTDELLCVIVHTDHSFADYTMETAQLVVQERDDFDGDGITAIAEIQDFLEVWAEYYVAQRRLERTNAGETHYDD